MVESLATSCHPRLKRRWCSDPVSTRGCRRGSSCRRRRRPSYNAHAAIRLSPQPSAGGPRSGIPAIELRQGDAVALGDRRAAIASLHEVEFVAIRDHAALDWARCCNPVSGSGGAGLGG
jgi:hypothetical protein